MNSLKKIKSCANLSKRSFSSKELFEKFDQSQTKSFNENLILVDENDNRVGAISKLNAHLKSEKNKFPHRAFSVFLFNKNNELLLQKRSNKKITFSNLWSNTCCSHPLDIDDERDTNEGIRRAAQRRMNYELGIESDIAEYKIFEKILYRADSDNSFEEYELDYILLAKNSDEQFNEELIKKRMNLDEASDVTFMNKEELLENVSKNKIKITPWFSLLIKNRIEEIFHKANKINTENDKNITNNKIIRYL